MGFFVGLLIVIKDLNDVKGLRMMFGLFFFFDNLVLEDDDVVVLVCSVGVIILGKINVFEYGFGVIIISLLFGVVWNFFNFDLSVGVLIGGGVVVFVVCMVFFVLGFDFVGFLWIFVVFCGIIGIWFLNGVVGIMCCLIVWSFFDVEGLMVRMVVDCKFFF